MTLRLVLAVVLALPTPVPAQDTAATAVSRRPALEEAEIARRIDAHLGFLASDALGGRDTGSVEGRITAEYVASVFRSLGLQPGAGESYLQSYPLISASVDQEHAGLVLLGQDGAPHQTFTPFDDFAVRGYGVAGLDLRGPLVFAGYGVVDEQAGVDDYADLDVTGCFVVVLSGAPEGRAVGSSTGWRGKQAPAEERGALGVVVVSAGEDDQQSLRYARFAMSQAAMTLGGVDDESEQPFPRLYVERDVGKVLFEGAGLDLGSEMERRRVATTHLAGFGLGQQQLMLQVPVRRDELSAENALGLLVGRDPALEHEVVILSAHMDHVGTDAAGRVYNGADDNASGTTALLTVAEILARHPQDLRRSVLFLAVSGEEKDLLGSKWWVEHPTVDLDRVVADINIDMVGRNDPDTIGLTPSPQHADYNSIVARAVELAPEAGLEVTWFTGEGRYRHLVDDYYERSDHVNFARAGIPVAFFFAGEHEDYHRPTDTLEKLDRAKIRKLVDLICRLTREVAEADERPARISG